MARIVQQDGGNHAESVARGELRPGERLVWWGQPRFSALLRQGSAASLIGIPFIAFAILWTSMAYFSTRKDGGPIGLFFPLWGVMFIGIGLFILTRPLWQASKSGTTVYGITDQRLFIVRDGRERKVQSYAPESIQPLERTERQDGSGDIVFRREMPSSTYRSNLTSQQTKIGFFGVPEIRRVEDAIRKLIQSNPTRD
jgi:hypothetical protein